eukprot:TRINITY_DN4041_c0_g1_i1.p1 TRINITY_DN4041_c0_g1~~TRINITY_DN4041_c0_g1_i1.p1  ORF type:complete len:345 (-),score=88.84 TRINITY_DN4041_c0_g1_i1:162-1169(-)
MARKPPATRKPASGEKPVKTAEKTRPTRKAKSKSSTSTTKTTTKTASAKSTSTKSRAKKSTSTTSSRSKSRTATKKTVLPTAIAKDNSHAVLNGDQVAKASTALLKHVNAKADAKNEKTRQLFDYEDTVFLTITLHKVPMKRRLKPHLIPLPHSLYDETAEICVIVKDPVKEVKALFNAQDVPNVAKVIGIQKVRDNFGQFEARRKLLNTYDLFLCDDRVALLLPRLLGKPFIKSKRVPAPIRIGKNNLVNQVTRARDSTMLFIPSGTQVSVRIGLTSQTPEQLTDNIMESINRIAGHFDQRWASIRTLSIRTSDSVALPIYSSLPPVPRPAKKK